MYCPHCGRDIPVVEGQHFCQFCGGRLVSPAESGATEVDSTEPSGGYCPWEDQETLGLLVGMYRTAKESLLTPEAFFSMLPIRGGYANPLLYGMILGTIGAMVSAVWAFVSNNPIMMEAARMGNLTIIGGLLIPISVFLEIMLLAGLLHIALLLVGGAHEDFEATFRVVCYTSVANLFSLIPIVGGLVGLACKLYLTLVGLKQVHRISTAKAVVAILLPALIISALVVLAITVTVISSGTGTE